MTAVGAWLLAHWQILAVGALALALVGSLYALRSEHARRVAAEGRVAGLVEALDAAAESEKTRAQAIADRDRQLGVIREQLGEVHGAYERERVRLGSVRREVAAIVGADEAAAMLDRAFADTPDAPGDASRERWVAP